MKRRIYWDHESGAVDATSCWTVWRMDDWNEDPVPLPVLQDEALWAEYKAAQAKVRALELRIGEVSTAEPWSALELRLGREATKLLRDSDCRDGGAVDRFGEIEAELERAAYTAEDVMPCEFGDDCAYPGLGWLCGHPRKIP